MKKPLVTIVIPSYNRAGLIEHTVRSLKEQTLENFECIIVDDNSTDQSVAAVNEAVGDDERFYLIIKDKKLARGAQVSRNLGIRRAAGEYLIFLDSDDLLAPECLGSRLEFMTPRPQLDFAVFPGLRFKDEMYDTLTIISTYRGNDPISQFLKFNTPWTILNVIWRRQSLLQHDIFFDENIMGYQDIEFHLQALFRGLCFAYAETGPDCFWREHAQGNTGKMLFNDSYIFSHVKLLHKFAASTTGKHSVHGKYNKKVKAMAMLMLKMQLDQGRFSAFDTFLAELVATQFISGARAVLVKWYGYFFKLFHGKGNQLAAKIMNLLSKMVLLQQPPFYRANKHFLIHQYKPSDKC